MPPCRLDVLACRECGGSNERPYSRIFRKRAPDPPEASIAVNERSGSTVHPSPHSQKNWVRTSVVGWPQGQGRQVGARNVTSDNRWQLEVDKGINRELSMRRRSFARSDSKLRDITYFYFFTFASPATLTLHASFGAQLLNAMDSASRTAFANTCAESEGLAEEVQALLCMPTVKMPGPHPSLRQRQRRRSHVARSREVFASRPGAAGSSTESAIMCRARAPAPRGSRRCVTFAAKWRRSTTAWSASRLLPLAEQQLALMTQVISVRSPR